MRNSFKVIALNYLGGNFSKESLSEIESNQVVTKICNNAKNYADIQLLYFLSLKTFFFPKWTFFLLHRVCICFFLRQEYITTLYITQLIIFFSSFLFHFKGI